MSGAEYILTALRSIGQNKVRALLTTLGVIIGVMSVILLIALGESAQAYVSREFAIMGSNIIIVTPGKQETTGLIPITAGSHRKLTYEMAKAIRRKGDGVSAVCANSIGLASIKYGTRTRNVMCAGTTPDWETIRELHAQVGRFITQQDVDRNNKVVVIGTKVKQELFGDKRALYEKVSINGTKHVVVGILENRGMALGIDLGDIAIIPLRSAQQMYKHGEDELWEILVGTRSPADIKPAIASIKRILASYHDGEEDFTVTDQDGMLSTFSRIFDMLKVMLVGIASISLLVGGIGIMNIMLVSVRERTREVGVRKAVGAKRMDIALQFLIEAVTLSLLGGFIGIALGGIGTFSIHIFYPSLPIGVSLWSALMSFFFAVAVGVFSGVYPAYKAAGVDPVIALRYE